VDFASACTTSFNAGSRAPTLAHTPLKETIMTENKAGSMMAGFLMGAVVGAGLALIFAPTSGSETRRQIGDAARKVKDGTRGRVDQVMGAIKEGAGDVSAAIGAGKEAFRRNAETAPLEKEHV
jgi:gas vesicle protein